MTITMTNITMTNRSSATMTMMALGGAAAVGGFTGYAQAVGFHPAAQGCRRRGG